MGRFLGFPAIAAGAFVLLAACSRTTAIPSGGQQVHVVITSTAIQLAPSMVHPGDVYLVLDEPQDGSLSFVSRSPSTGSALGPLSDTDLDRLRRGDVQSTGASGFEAGGCSPDQNAQDRGRMGPCGNVMKVNLAPGKYAVVAGAPEDLSADGSGPPIAILQVLP